MRINTKIVIDMATYEVIERESYEDPTDRIAQCCGGGPGGGGDSPGISSGQPTSGAPGITGSEAGIIGASGESVSSVQGGYEAGAPGASGVSFGRGEGVSSSERGTQVSFSSTGAQIGAFFGGMAGPGGAAVGALVGGVIGSAIQGSGVPGGTDMSGDPTGGNAIAGPDPLQRQRAVAGAVKTKGKEEKPGVPSLKDVTPRARDTERERARKRPQTILTSPLGLRSRPTIRRATLLGG